MTSSTTGAAASGCNLPFLGRIIRRTAIAATIKTIPMNFNIYSIRPPRYCTIEANPYFPNSAEKIAAVPKATKTKMSGG